VRGVLLSCLVTDSGPPSYSCTSCWYPTAQNAVATTTCICVNSRILPRLGHDHFLPIHYSLRSYHTTLYSLRYRQHHKIRYKPLSVCCLCYVLCLLITRHLCCFCAPSGRIVTNSTTRWVLCAGERPRLSPYMERGGAKFNFGTIDSRPRQNMMRQEWLPTGSICRRDLILLHGCYRVFFNWISRNQIMQNITSLCWFWLPRSFMFPVRSSFVRKQTLAEESDAPAVKLGQPITHAFTSQLESSLKNPCTCWCVELV
jgi:hypothetical protein